MSPKIPFAGPAAAESRGEMFISPVVTVCVLLDFTNKDDSRNEAVNAKETSNKYRYEGFEDKFGLEDAMLAISTPFLTVP